MVNKKNTELHYWILNGNLKQKNNCTLLYAVLDALSQRYMFDDVTATLEHLFRRAALRSLQETKKIYSTKAVTPIFLIIFLLRYFRDY